MVSPAPAAGRIIFIYLLLKEELLVRSQKTHRDEPARIADLIDDLAARFFPVESFVVRDCFMLGLVGIDKMVREPVGFQADSHANGRSRVELARMLSE